MRERRLRRRGDRRGGAPARARADARASTRCASGAASTTSACSRPGRGGSRRRSASRPRTTGSTLEQPAVRADRAERFGRRRRIGAGRHHARRRPAVALLARRLYVREPSPTTSVTPQPARDCDTGLSALAEDCAGATRRGLGPELDLQARQPRAARRRGSSRRSSGACPCSRLRDPDRHRVVRGEPAASADPGSTTMPGSRPGLRRRVGDASRRAAARAECASAPAFVIPTTSGTETSFGLQSASVSGPSPEK